MPWLARVKKNTEVVVRFWVGEGERADMAYSGQEVCAFVA